MQASPWIAMGFVTLAMLTAPSLAQDLPSEGTFSITFTAVDAFTAANPIALKPVPTGKDSEAMLTIYRMSAMNDAGSGLLHNMAGRCTAWGTLDKAASTFEEHGWCVYADGDGDQIFEKYD